MHRIFCPYIFTLNCKEETKKNIKEEETLDKDHDVPLLMKTEIVEETIKHEVEENDKRASSTKCN